MGECSNSRTVVGNGVGARPQSVGLTFTLHMADDKLLLIMINEIRCSFAIFSFK